MRNCRSARLSGTFLLLLLVQCGHNNFADPPNPPSTQATTANTTVFDNVQQWTGWLTCGACGDSGGQGALATYQMTQGVTSPSLSGSSARFSIGGSYPYANAYWYYRHQPRDTAMASLVYEFDLYVPSGSENAPQAIEFECQQRLDGYVYNFAWQAEYTANRWRVFNYTLRQWEDSGISLQRFAADSWHHIVAVYHNNATAHVAYHDTLTVDGVQYTVNMVHPATFTGNQTNEFTNAFQLDLNGSATAYSVYADRMRVTQVN